MTTKSLLGGGSSFLFLLVCLLAGGCSREDAGSRAPAGAEPVNPLDTGGAGESPLTCVALPADLEAAVVRTVGRVAGVLVRSAAPDGWASKAGIRAGDILIAVGSEPVGDPDRLDDLLSRAEAGRVLTLLRLDAEGEWGIERILLTGGARAAVPAAPEPSAPVETPKPEPDRSLAGCVNAYFDLLDFSRSQAWGRESVTGEETRRRALNLLKKSVAGMTPAQRAAVRKLPDVLEELLEKWRAATEADREKQREYWRWQVLLPNPLLPPPPSLEHYASSRGDLEFDRPRGWLKAETNAEGSSYLFVAPPATAASWPEIANPATCPAGALFVLAPLTDEVRETGDVVKGTRLVCQEYVLPFVPQMKEVAAFPVGRAALVVLRGPRPGGATEHFYWVGTMPYSSETFLAIRFGGPVGEVETLMPALTTILATMEVTPPDEVASLMIDLAASTIGNAVINAGWSH